MDKYYLLIFKNTQGALKVESFLKSKDIKLVIMPTPTHITQSCGISVRLVEEEFLKTKGWLKDGTIEYKHVYMKEGTGFSQVEI